MFLSTWMTTLTTLTMTSSSEAKNSDCFSQCLKLCNQFNGDFNQVVHQLPRSFEAGFEAGVDLLLKKKVQINIRTEGYEFPLHVAAKFGHSGIVRLLLAYKAYKDIINNKSIKKECRDCCIL